MTLGGSEFIRDEIDGALLRAAVLGANQADAVMTVLREAGLDALPSDIPDAKDDREPSWCEWPTNSGWRTATCGRAGARAAENWGIRLCWQHEDAVLSEALALIKSGRCHEQVLDVLVEVVKDDLLRPRHAAWADAIDHEIIRRLRAGEWLSASVKEAFNDYITAAIRKKWSA